MSSPRNDECPAEADDSYQPPGSSSLRGRHPKAIHTLVRQAEALSGIKKGDLKPDKIIDLEEIDSRLKSQKIESVTKLKKQKILFALF
jgi:hypothetical protein